MSKPIRNLLLVYKKSSRLFDSRGRWVEESPSHLHSFVRPDMKRPLQAQRSHSRTFHLVTDCLREEGIRFRTVYKARACDYSPYDLIITVGGDGTFLEASRQIRNQWILGVNSDPVRSAGSFCSADGKNFKKIFRRILAGKGKSEQLHRLELRLNKTKLLWPVLNEVLVAHRKPAAMSRYWLAIGKKEEEQRGSGVWMATAAGSTGALRSAGGVRLPRGSSKLSYQPRELFRGGRVRYQLTGGTVTARQRLQIGSLMREGVICVDGNRVQIPLGYGDLLEIKQARYPLRLIS